MKSKHNLYHKILSIFLLALVLLANTRCDDDFEWDIPFGVATNAITIEATAGETHIMVYSTGEWNVKFEEPINWASIDKIMEEKNSTILFSYSENFGPSRKAILRLSKSGEEDILITITQEGSPAQIVFKEQKVTIPKTGLPITIGLTNNLRYNLDEIDVEVIYDDEISEKWVSEINITTETFEFVSLENNLGEDRTARVYLRYVDGEDKTYSTYVDLTQTIEDAYLNVAEEISYFTKFAATSTQDINTNMNNVSLSITGVESADGTDWIATNIVDNQLQYSLTENNSGKTREAKIIIETSNKMFKAEHQVIQFNTASKIVTFEELKGMITATSGVLALTDPIAALEGIVISDKDNLNMETNPNTAFNKIDFTVNDKTAYIQAIDGSHGVRIQTESVEDNVFNRYSKVTLSLKDLVLVKEANPERYTLQKVTASSLNEETTGTVSNLVAKEKTIAQLTDADIYTYVTLKETEFGVPYGMYMCVNRGYVVRIGTTNAGIVDGGYMDTYPVPIRDKEGSTMHVLVNSKPTWYLNLRSQGSGNMKGILVHTTSERYGIDASLGRYSLRPFDESDVKVEGAPFSKKLVEWNWLKDGSDVTAAGSINKDADGNVLPVVGSGKLYCTAPSVSPNLGNSFHYVPDIDSKIAIGSAIQYNAKWWNTTTNTGEAFVFNFSTQDIASAKDWSINFTQGGGSGSTATYPIPTYWQIEYSTDGTNYTVLPNSKYVVRPLPAWGDAANTAMGTIEYTYTLPKELLGKANVFVRLKAASNTCLTSTGAVGTITESTPAINVRLGFVTFKYVQ